MLGEILTKQLLEKPIILWDEYLPSALFACRVRAHSVTGISPYKLVYGLEPRLTGDQKDFDTKNLDADFASRLETLHTARHEANRLLVERGLYSKKLRSDRLRSIDTGYSEGDYVILRNEAKQKFEATYFGPFRVLKKLWFGTYILETGDNRVLRKPTHGSRLLRYYRHDANKETRIALTSAWVRRLREINETLEEASPEVLEVLNLEDITPPTYHDLSLMSKREWL